MEHKDTAHAGVHDPLHHAVTKGNLAEISRLLDTGSDVNARNGRDCTPLHLAVKHDNLEIVRYLLAHGADPDLGFDAGGHVYESYDAPVLAALGNATAIMQELITHGVRFHSRVLGYAAAAGHMDMVRLLVENPTVGFSDMSREEAFKKTLPAACKSWSFGLVQYFLEKLGFGKAGVETNEDRQGTLNMALLTVFNREGIYNPSMESDAKPELDWSSATQIIKLLVEAGAQVNIYTQNWVCTPLDFTLLQPILPAELIDFLLANGADVNATGDCCGRTAFFDLLAHPNATAELIKSFEAAGGMMKVVDPDGNTPLHCVQNVDAARWLLRSGADSAATNNRGEAPLHAASIDGRIEIALELLVAGASVDQRTNLGYTPLMRSSDVGVSKILLQYGADVNAATDLGWTALHEFSEKCDTEQTSLLLSNGANVHALAIQERWSWNPGPTWSTVLVRKLTPLHVAVYIREAALPDTVAALLDHGADIEAKDSSGNTPLLLAIATDGFGAPVDELVNCLLDRGASREAVDGRGRNAVQLADARQYRINEEGKFERKPVPQAGHNPQGAYIYVHGGRGRRGRMGPGAWGAVTYQLHGLRNR